MRPYGYCVGYREYPGIGSHTVFQQTSKDGNNTRYLLCAVSVNICVIACELPAVRANRRSLSTVFPISLFMAMILDHKFIVGNTTVPRRHRVAYKQCTTLESVNTNTHTNIVTEMIFNGKMYGQFVFIWFFFSK